MSTQRPSEVAPFGDAQLRHQFAERAPMPMAEVEEAGYFIRYVNPAFCRLIGKTSEDLIGKSLAEIVVEANDCLVLIDRVFQTRESQSYTAPLPMQAPPLLRSYVIWPILVTQEKPDTVMIQVTDTALFHHQPIQLNQSIVAALGQHETTDEKEPLANAYVQTDIAELEQAEKARATLAAIVESSDDAIIAKDLNGVITSWNRGAEQLFGYTAEEAIYQPVSMLIPPERMDEEPDILNRIRHGERIEHYETVRRRKDGTLIDISLSVSPIIDAHGKIVGASKIARDITLRTRTEKQLRKSEERFRTVADSSPVMIWMTDATGRTTFLNRTALDYFAATMEQSTTFDWSEAVHPDDRHSYVAAFKTALETHQTFHQRVRLRRFDGQWRWFESRGNPLLDDTGAASSYIGISPDITEIYESQQKLRELDQRKDEFLANMSHEIRSPLTGIMGYADVLLERLKDREDVECLKTIKESGDYLLELVNDILDLSKIEAGKLILNLEPVSIHGVLTEIQGLMAVRAKQKGLTLALQYDGVIPELVQTDRTRVRQLLINLVSNAIKFTERGRVDIVARFVADRRLLLLEVIDTGIGIAPEHQELLFHPFNQGDSTSSRKFGGTGLGLAISKRLVEMLGGRISFESELNHGSTFRLAIPTGTAGTAQIGSKLADAGSADGISLQGALLSDHHVLIVDDREEICYLLRRYIKDAGGRAHAVSDGEAAIEAVQRAAAGDPFDAILLDIQMPQIDGYQVARTLRANGFKMPIIALTANAMVGDREKCLRAGCDDYLTKPIDRTKLLQLIAYHAQQGGPDLGITGSTLRILLVDDSYAACKLLGGILKKRGHEIRAVFDGESAIAIAKEFHPDIVFSDIRLPDMNGCELVRHLKKVDGLNQSKFVALSGYRVGDIPGSHEFDHFLEKPVDRAQLDAVLAAL